MLWFGLMLVSCGSQVRAQAFRGPPVNAYADRSIRIDIMRRVSDIDAAISSINTDIVDLKSAGSKPNPQVTDLLDQVRALQAAVHGNSEQLQGQQEQLQTAIKAIEGQLQAAINKSNDRAFLERMSRFERSLKALDKTLTNLQAAINPPTPELIFPFPTPTMNKPVTTAQLEADGWNLVFRGTAGNGQNVYNAYISGTSTTSSKPTDMSRSDSSHYRLETLDTQWSTLKPAYVKYALYQDGQEVAVIIFKTLEMGSTYTNWFDNAQILFSSWSKLKSNELYDDFSIEGVDSVGLFERRFYVGQSVGLGCDDLKGFVVAIGPGSDCNFDKHFRYPQFLYSTGNFANSWETRPFGQADYMAIFIF